MLTRAQGRLFIAAMVMLRYAIVGIEDRVVFLEKKVLKEKLTKSVREQLRKRAVEQTKKELLLRGTDIEQLQQHELAYLVQAAEKDIVSQWKQRGLLAVAALFGITVV